MTGSRELERAGLSFFGEVTAGVTHDIRNSLAILKEISGLLSDLADAAGEGGSISAERVKGIAGRLDNQVNRANATVGLLNRFAHSVDSPRRMVDLPETVGMLTDLAKRQAHRNRVNLVVVIPDVELTVESDPFLLEHAIFLLLGRTIESADVGGTVTLTLVPGNEGACVRLSGAARGKVKLKGSVSRILTMLGSSAEYEDRCDTLVLKIPGRMPGREESNDG